MPRLYDSTHRRLYAAYELEIQLSVPYAMLNSAFSSNGCCGL